jgi:hypothetical protein
MMKRLLPYAVLEYRMPIDEDATGSAHHRPNSASRSYPPSKHCSNGLQMRFRGMP